MGSSLSLLQMNASNPSECSLLQGNFSSLALPPASQARLVTSRVSGQIEGVSWAFQERLQQLLHRSRGIQDDFQARRLKLLQHMGYGRKLHR